VLFAVLQNSAFPIFASWQVRRNLISHNVKRAVAHSKDRSLFKALWNKKTRTSRNRYFTSIVAFLTCSRLLHYFGKFLAPHLPNQQRHAGKWGWGWGINKWWGGCEKVGRLINNISFSLAAYHVHVLFSYRWIRDWTQKKKCLCC